MKKLKKILVRIITIFLILVLVFNIYNVINIKILKNDLTSINGYAILEVVSGSMEPTINVGDLIIIKTKDYHYRENDIITFYDTNNSFVTHRLIKLKNDKEMITKGDNNDSEDEVMSRDNIVGKYMFRIKGLGKLLTALRNPIVSIMILIIGILVGALISIDKDNEDNLEIDDAEYQKFLAKKERDETRLAKKKRKKIKANINKKIKSYRRKIKRYFNKTKRKIIKLYKNIKKRIQKKKKIIMKKINNYQKKKNSKMK